VYSRIDERGGDFGTVVGEDDRVLRVHAQGRLAWFLPVQRPNGLRQRHTDGKDAAD